MSNMVLKKYISLLIALLIALSTFCVSSFAIDSPNDASEDIKLLIEGFFKDYEKAFDAEDLEFSDCDKYFVNDSSTENIKLLIRTILYRRILLSQGYSDEHLKEENKDLQFNYQNISINDEDGKISVFVTTTYNYNISPDVDSEERTEYLIDVEKDLDTWKISDIEGFIEDIIKEDFDNNNIDIYENEDLIRYQNSLKSRIEKFYETYNDDINKVSDNSEIDVVTAKESAVVLDSSILTNKIGVTAPLYTIAATYNSTGAANYALKWALDRNPNYANFDGSGGDCTNFVSQCMDEGGGLSEHFGTAYSTNSWYYTTSTNRSATWTGASQLNSYLKSSSSKINASVSNWSSVYFGDIIQLMSSSGSAYHSLIISGIAYSTGGRSDLLICCHTSDKKHKSLAYYFGGITKQYFDIKGNK